MIIDTFLSVIAPQQCIACGIEGSVLCRQCLMNAGDPIHSRCAGCKTVSKNFKTCSSCRSWINAYSVHVATNYDGVYEQLVRALKFDVKRAAVEPIVNIMAESISGIPSNVIACPLPTAPSRVRQRGFDHSMLIAKKLARKNEIRFMKLLNRRTNVRQLGSTRAKRIEQMKSEFYLRKNTDIKGKDILLIDDVMTTGASVAAAARTLKNAGARRVYAVVFAQKVQ